ncbi:hypothetical protein [Methylobacterium sp.]|uniref:hypothetical protein n=1 Tax=Methylobacterium sp. TaxID=409 RepID=UPI0025E615E5|nr:hypothetical protein [Methylobacterium sp.]MBY0256127.1 hypothetical protein [Methylobacterium sp.]
MRIAVKHQLQLYDPADASLREQEAYVLPVREAQAVMGETVAAYLARVEWHFDLPTVCRVNGQFYGRAEWDGLALAMNDNVEFVSRPLGGGGGGSTAKTIASVVALVALTAVAGPAGTAAAAALQVPAFASAVVASAISAAIVGAGAMAISYFLKPKSGGKTNASDALYTFGFQGNAARPMQPIPVLHGRIKFAPDYAAPTYSDALGDTLTDFGDSRDCPSRLRPAERGSRAHRWATAWSGRRAFGARAEGADLGASASHRVRAWAKRVAGVLRRSRDVAVRYLRPSRGRHAGDVAHRPGAVRGCAP